ncbi:MAG: hypothetical protein CMP23_13150 [Rickettsiales bacterium]|nr:hypothetical protein [Rickettsiales bacterium]
MARLSLLLGLLTGITSLFAVACISPAPADDDDDDTNQGISCATADEAWAECAAVTGSPTPAPFCSLLAAGQVGADSDWGCIASLLGQWDCATGLPSGLDEFGTCINLNPGDDDDSVGDDDDSSGGDDDDDIPTGPCTDDGYEPNNEIATASPLTPGSYSDMVSCPEDLDYYAVGVNSGEFIRASFTFLDEEGDIDVQIKDGNDGGLDYGSSSTDNEEVAVLADTSTTYYVYAKLFSDSGTAVGNPYSLTITTGTPQPEVCGDGIDNDVDQSTDCADDDCADDPSCLEDCSDGVDNDADFRTDCADSDCDNSPLCVEDCSDGIDNDADGRTDCADSGCDSSPLCVENCSDGIDNDADGRIDCLDSGCSADAACICPSDPYEENDSYQGPKPIASSASPYTGLNTCLDDEDWYSFSSNGTPTITLDFLDADGDIDCKLYDADSAQWTADPNDPNWTPNLTESLVSSTSTGDSEDCSVTSSTATNGNYLLRVYFYASQSTDPNGVGNSYTLNISY